MLDMTPDVTRLYLTTEKQLKNNKNRDEEKFLMNATLAEQFPILRRQFEQNLKVRTAPVVDLIVKMACES